VVELPAGTVTFLFSDIEGSTELLKRLGDEYGALISDHCRLVREAAADLDGAEIGPQGDAFFVAFARASDAVAAAGRPREGEPHWSRRTEDLGARVAENINESVYRSLEEAFGELGKPPAGG
jgi:class 3 adenylate cyclase